METLRTLAEIAVGFAGFASIVVAFRQRGEAWAPADGVLYRVMLTNSLASCAFALLPVILVEFGLSEDALWAASSSLVVAFVAYRLFVTFGGRNRATNRLVWRRDWTLLVLVTLQFSLQAVNIFGFPIERGPGPYVAGVALYLASAGQAFFRLLVLPTTAETTEAQE